jgi:hypothetical protein
MLFTRQRQIIEGGYIYSITQEVLEHLPAIEAVTRLKDQLEGNPFPDVSFSLAEQTRVEIIGGDAFVVKDVVMGRTPLGAVSDSLGLPSMDLETPVMTEILNTVAFKRSGSQFFLVAVAKPSIRKILFYGSTAAQGVRLTQEEDSASPPGRRFVVALPKMVLFWKFQSESLLSVFAYATKDEPLSDDTALYRLPLPNIYAGDYLCLGSLDVSASTASRRRYKSVGHRVDDYFLRWISAQFNQDLFRLPQGVNSFQQWEDMTRQDPRMMLGSRHLTSLSMTFRQRLDSF